jgi:hypothetical protein
MIYLIILLAVISRFVPHLNNFAPITALAIFSAVYLPKKQAIIIPLAARLVSDIFLGFFSWPLMVAVYVSHLAGVLFGLWIRNTVSSTPTEVEGSVPLDGQISLPTSRDRNGGIRWLKVIFSSLGASILFFLVTNFAFLYTQYPHNWQGIILAYTNGLPFLRGTLLGDLSYTVALFGAYEFVKYLASQRQVQKQKM